jgi:NAD+ synthetase
MKIAVCQINTTVGAISLNKAKIIDSYKKALQDKADLAVVPELALVGYPPLDLVEKQEFRKAASDAASEIASVTEDAGLIFGSITERSDRIGTDIHNSAILCYKGKIQFVQHKSLIPNYDVFDEMRYFDPAAEVFVHEFKGEKLGISICEDIWNDADYWFRQRYSRDPINELIAKGSTLLINISASPYSYGKREDRKKMLSVLTRQNKIGLVYVCFAGTQADLIFDGASMCFDKSGNLTALGKNYEEDYFIYDSNKKYPPIENSEGSFEEEILNALIFGLKEYCTKVGFNKVLVGLSGGIDSALVGYLAVQAVGKENVNAVLMPSKYSTEGSIKDSLKLIKNLGIAYDKVPIQPAVDITLQTLKPVFGDLPEDVTEENIQARMRAVYLMAVSNKFNYLLLTTGNKSEMAVGYCTLYGDMAGGLAVIADLYKTDIYRLVKYINRNEEIIPNEIIRKVPSAELSFGQTDQDVLPPYEVLDKILRMYLEENKEINEITGIIGDKDLVKKVLRMVDQSEFKRKQAAPALRVSKKAFGYGRRYPIVQGWRR